MPIIPLFSTPGGRQIRVGYAPAESDTNLFGGNSNRRGPIWFPVNYLIIEALERYHHHYGDDLKVEMPTGSGNWCNLQQVADELSLRLTRLFMADEGGRRPCFGNAPPYPNDPEFRGMVLFHEYFDGDNGKGLGAEHQTGWTALVVRCLENVKNSLTNRQKAQ